MNGLVPLSILAATQVIMASALGHVLGELHNHRQRLDAHLAALRVLARPLHVELPPDDGDGEKPRHLRALALLLPAGPALWLWTHLRAHPHIAIGTLVGATGAAVISGLLLAPNRSTPSRPAPPPRAAGPVVSRSPSPDAPTAPSSSAPPSTPPPPPTITSVPSVIVVALPPPAASVPPPAIPTPSAPATIRPTATTARPATATPTPSPIRTCPIGLTLHLLPIGAALCI